MYIAIKSAMESSQALQIAQQSFGKCSACTFMAYSPHLTSKSKFSFQTGLCLIAGQLLTHREKWMICKRSMKVTCGGYIWAPMGSMWSNHLNVKRLKVWSEALHCSKTYWQPVIWILNHLVSLYSTIACGSGSNNRTDFYFLYSFYIQKINLNLDCAMKV